MWFRRTPVTTVEPGQKIEQDTRRYVRRAKGDVFVITGPLFGKVPQTICEDKVRAPESIYKVVLDSSTGKNWVHWHTNSAEKQALAPYSYADFRQQTGLELLKK